MLIYLISTFLDLNSIFLGISGLVSVLVSSLVVKKLNTSTSLKIVLVSVSTLILFIILYSALSLLFTS